MTHKSTQIKKDMATLRRVQREVVRFFFKIHQLKASVSEILKDRRDTPKSRRMKARLPLIIGRGTHRLTSMKISSFR